ncbi:MAG TPA: hypothetical protein PK208_12030 [Fibrobacteria bacterium]|nr:hypothetical protein [Fibrobacteria bacterium]
MRKVTIKSIKRRVRGRVVALLRESCLYYTIYPAWWRMIFTKPKGKTGVVQYLAARPNAGAGIGHQIANWIAGYWFSRVFDLGFAHIPFSNPKWEGFLGFGNNENRLQDLIEKKGYRLVRLPLFAEFDAGQVELIRKLIQSHEGEKVVFLCEQDQFYRDQFGVMNEIRQKFHAAQSGKTPKFYTEKAIHIALHVRRGDIAVSQNSGNANLQMRWQNVDYFDQVLRQLIDAIPASQPYQIHVFSQGARSEFALFDRFPEVKFHLESDEFETFQHFAGADVLVTSKSSFSYKPALLSRGLKICPRNFWHGYPAEEDWFLVNDSGELEKDDLDRLNRELSRRFPVAG